MGENVSELVGALARVNEEGTSELPGGGGVGLGGGAGRLRVGVQCLGGGAWRVHVGRVGW